MLSRRYDIALALIHLEWYYTQCEDHGSDPVIFVLTVCDVPDYWTVRDTVSTCATFPVPITTI